MAATTGKKKSTTVKRGSTTRSARSFAATKSHNTHSETSILSVLHSLKGHPLGRVLLAILVLSVLVGFNFLISFNSMDRFFIAVGIEFILLVLIGWVRFVLRGKAGEDS